MRVGGDDERTGQHVAVLHHDLVADAGARRIEVDAMLACEGFHAAILGQVRLFDVLDIVIGGEDWLLGIVHMVGANAP